MKKILMIAAVIFLTSTLFACGSAPASTETETEAVIKPTEALIGVWTYDLGGYACTFNADGTGSYDTGTVKNFTYSATDTEISITYEGNTEPLVLPYEIAGNLLTVKDSFGEDVFYMRQQ